MRELMNASKPSVDVPLCIGQLGSWRALSRLGSLPRGGRPLALNSVTERGNERMELVALCLWSKKNNVPVGGQFRTTGPQASPEDPDVVRLLLARKFRRLMRAADFGIPGPWNIVTSTRWVMPVVRECRFCTVFTLRAAFARKKLGPVNTTLRRSKYQFQAAKPPRHQTTRFLPMADAGGHDQARS